MNSDDLFSAIGDADDRYLSFLKEEKRRGKGRVLLLLAAAVLALAAVCAVLFFALKKDQNPPPVSPAATDPETGLTTTAASVEPTSVDPTPVIIPSEHVQPPVYAIAHQHEWATEKPVKPTCTFPGRTSGEYCAICSQVKTYAEVIAPLGGDHVYKDGVCTRCGQRQPNEGYVFALSEDGASYEIVSASGAAGPVFVIPESYNGKPVTAIRATDFFPDYGEPAIGRPTVHFYLGDNVKEISSLSLTIRGKTRPVVHVHDLIAWCAINEKENEELTERDSVFWQDSFLGTNGALLCLEDEYLTDVVLPLTTTVFGRHSFCFNTLITSVTMPSCMTKIFDGAFVGCHSLTDFHFSWQINEIGFHAFENSGVRHIDVPFGVTELKSYTFNRCGALETVGFPSSLKRIGDSCFAYCSFDEIDLPEGLETVDLFAFFNTRIGTLKLPSTLRTVGDYAFYGSDCVLYISDLASYLTCDFSGKNGNPANHASEIWIGDLLFDGKLTIPQGVSRLGRNSLAFGTDFAELHFPATVTECGFELFGSNKVEKLYIEDLASFVTIDFGVFRNGQSPFARADRIFAGNEEITDRIVVPAVSRLGDHVFSYSRFKEIVLPKGLTEICDSAFVNCSNLTHIEIPQSVRSIGKSAFAYCSSLKSAALPDCSVGEDAFTACFSITSIENVSIYGTIGERMFAGCTGLEKLTVPAGVSKIAAGAFVGCSNLKTIEFEERSSPLTIESAAFGHAAIKEIVIPSLTTVCDDCFLGCSALKSIWISEDVTLLENWNAFCPADVYLPGTWEMKNGKPARIVDAGEATLEMQAVFSKNDRMIFKKAGILYE